MHVQLAVHDRFGGTPRTHPHAAPHAMRGPSTAGMARVTTDSVRLSLSIDHSFIRLRQGNAGCRELLGSAEAGS